MRTDLKIEARWVGDDRFETGRPGVPTAVFDGTAKAAQNPVDALLSALAACAGIDVVDILVKRRTPPASLLIEVEAERRAEPPRRVVRIAMRFVVDGAAVEAVHAERAIGLAFEKYCSVAASLAPDIAVETVLVLNGVEHPPVPRQIWRAG